MTHKHTELIKVLSFKERQMVTDPRVVKRMRENVAINKKYNVPYLAGYSKDGKTIYIDKHFKPIMSDGTDVIPYLLIHEKLEKALIDFFGLDYQQAHHIATHEELSAVKRDGIDHNKYVKFYAGPIQKDEAERTGESPPDLDLTPYKCEKDCHKYAGLGI